MTNAYLEMARKKRRQERDAILAGLTDKGLGYLKDAAGQMRQTAMDRQAQEGAAARMQNEGERVNILRTAKEAEAEVNRQREAREKAAAEAKVKADADKAKAEAEEARRKRAPDVLKAYVARGLALGEQPPMLTDDESALSVADVRAEEARQKREMEDAKAKRDAEAQMDALRAGQIKAGIAKNYSDIAIDKENAKRAKEKADREAKQAEVDALKPKPAAPASPAGMNKVADEMRESETVVDSADRVLGIKDELAAAGIDIGGIQGPFDSRFEAGKLKYFGEAMDERKVAAIVRARTFILSAFAAAAKAISGATIAAEEMKRFEQQLATTQDTWASVIAKTEAMREAALNEVRKRDAILKTGDYLAKPPPRADRGSTIKELMRANPNITEAQLAEELKKAGF